MTCPFNENYTLPVGGKLYENAPTGHVVACNECLLNSECIGANTDGVNNCYKPCFGFELITNANADAKLKDIELTDAKFTIASTVYTQKNIELEIAEPYVDKWKYIMFLDDASQVLGSITTDASIVASTDTTDTTKTKITISGLVFTAGVTITASHTISFSLYRYRKKDATDSGFDTLQDVYAPVLKILDTMQEDHSDSIIDDYDIDLYDYKDDPADQIAKSIFSKVKGIYRSNTNNVRSSYMTKESIQKEIDAVKSLSGDKKQIVDNLEALNATSKRQIEINMYKSKKMDDTNKALMIVMIVVGCLVIFPILAKTKIASIGVFVGLWIVALLIVLIYMFYVLYYKKMGQDELVYAKYNFNKPSDKEVALSMAHATLSKSDKTRCQAFAELEDEFDFSDVGTNINVSDYTSQVDDTDKCSNID